MLSHMMGKVSMLPSDMAQRIEFRAPWLDSHRRGNLSARDLGAPRSSDRWRRFLLRSQWDWTHPSR